MYSKVEANVSTKPKQKREVKKMAYIIKNNEVVAIANTELKNGVEVQFSSLTTEEKVNANRNYNLVNAQTGKISRAKKWEASAKYADYATEINPGEFLL